MLRNNLITALRNFLRHPIYSTINVSGLVLGLTSCVFIFLWVWDEISYDRYHKDNDLVFKVMETVRFSDGEISTDQFTPGLLAETLKSQFPEVEQTSRVAWDEDKLFRANDKANYEYGNYADKSIFEVLNLPLAEGDQKNPLPDNQSVAISKKMAERYFPKANALGNLMRINNEQDVKVTAVFENLPINSTESFDFILPMDLYVRDIDLNQWNNDGWLITFVKLKESFMRKQVDEKIKDVVKKHNEGFRPELFLFPMREWRLHNNFVEGKQSGGRINYVLSFSLIAAFILLIACINFMNLSTARSANRSREVGVRKVAGASRGALVRQFMFESVSLSLFSLVISLLLVHLLLPLFNDFTGKQLTVDYLDPAITGSLLGFALLTGLIAGSYPAFFLSSFRPASVLKGNLQSTFSGAALRRTLVVFQFGLSIIIIIAALVVNDQIAYMRNKNLGFDKKNVLSIKTNPELLKGYEVFHNDILQNPIITSIAIGAANPMEINGSLEFDWTGKASDDNTYFNVADCDYDYLETLGFTLVEGRNFSPKFPSDSNNFIVTEEVVRKMGVANPIGQHFKGGDKDGQIIGVIKDFHNLGIRKVYNPTVLVLGNNGNGVMDFGSWATIFIRYEPGKLKDALEYVQQVSKKVNSNFPVQIGFVDQDFERQFRTEIMVGTLSTCFTIIAIIISCLGLFGLALFSTERRVKEIGVRKVLGASVSGLVVLLCRDFVRLVIYAILLGSPLGYYLMEQFLSEYPYRTQLNLSMFVIAAIAMLSISLSIISYQAIKAALGNPVEALRME
jgi:ABC-type antimicrobial peptide transport system permease subunit